MFCLKLMNYSLYSIFFANNFYRDSGHPNYISISLFQISVTFLQFFLQKNGSPSRRIHGMDVLGFGILFGHSLHVDRLRKYDPEDRSRSLAHNVVRHSGHPARFVHAIVYRQAFLLLDLERVRTRHTVEDGSQIDATRNGRYWKVLILAPDTISAILKIIQISGTMDAVNFSIHQEYAKLYDYVCYHPFSVFILDPYFKFNRFPFWLALLLTCMWILMCATLFASWEEWDLFTSFYFFFQSLTTIGFGEKCYIFIIY